jgi:4'-phosphopantetheinyl transferase
MSAPSPGQRPAKADPPGRWPLGPRRPRLAVGTVHVWRADLTAVSDDLAEALSDDERRRAARIMGENERRAWSRARGGLRELLSRYLEVDALAVELVAGPHGKPELASAGEPPPLFFNISHSREVALYAFAADAPVGVDVQVARERGARSGVDHVALARRAFGEHEAQRLSLVEPGRREREFLRAWTSYEAELKRRGTGIGGHDGPSGGGEWIPPGPDTAPWIVELDVGARAAGALALRARVDELRRWSLS